MSCGFSVAYGMRMWHIVLLAISYRRYPPPLQSWAVTTVQTDCLQTRAGGDDPSTKCDDELSECTGKAVCWLWLGSTSAHVLVSVRGCKAIISVWS